MTAKTKETRHTVDNEWASKCVPHRQSVTQTNAKPDEKFRHESATNMQGSSSMMIHHGKCSKQILFGA